MPALAFEDKATANAHMLRAANLAFAQYHVMRIENLSDSTTADKLKRDWCAIYLGNLS